MRQTPAMRIELGLWEDIKKMYRKTIGILIFLCLLSCLGCGREESSFEAEDTVDLLLDEAEFPDMQSTEGAWTGEETGPTKELQSTNEEMPGTDEASKENGNMDITVENVDYNEYFNGIQGCAVIYDSWEDKYMYYNPELCEQEVSPFSTFKIISTLAGLQNGIIENEASTMEYSGTLYPISDWNENLTLKKAFWTSCVWYFRQVIDGVGAEELQRELDELQYGNCDLSEWGGSNVNPLPELNGFWLASSLKISPVAQVEVMRKIFEGESFYDETAIATLKNIMLLQADLQGVYGKTGSGSEGKAWFVGFFEENGSRVYFAVYLDDSGQKDKVSGSAAKEIALNLLGEMVTVPVD